MTFGFLTPLALLTLALGAVVLWLHARRKRRMVVPSLRLWRDLQIPTGTARASRQWPPMSWPLALQLLAIFFAAIALSAPYFGDKPARDQIFILDPEGGAESLAEQRNLLEERLASTTAPDHVSLILAGAEPRLLAARLAPEDLNLEQTFSAIPANDSARPDWSAVARRIEMLAPSEESDITLLSGKALPADLLPFGTKRLALTAEATRSQAAFSVRPMQTPFRFAFKGQVIPPEGVESTHLVIGYSDGSGIAPLPFLESELRPNSKGDIIFEGDVRLPGPGVMSITIDGIERARYLTEQIAAEESVLYIGKGEQPLLNALRAIDGVGLYQAESLPSDLSPYQMVVVDGVLLPEAPDAPTLWIGPSGIGDSAPQALSTSDPDSWDVNSTLLSGVDVKTLRPGTAWDLDLPQGAQTVVTAAGEPLVALLENEAWLAFDPRESNWIGRPELAIFTAALHGAIAAPKTLPACSPSQPCYPDNRLIGDDLSPAIEEPEELLVADKGPIGLARIALALAFAAVLADMALQMRGYKRLHAPAPLSIIALVLLGLGIFNTPLPRPLAGSSLIAIDVPQSTNRNALSLAEVTILSGDPPALAETGPESATAVKNASEALELAAASMPEGRSGHILLGGQLARRPEALPEGMPVSYLAPPAPPASEVVLRAIESIGHPMQGEPLPLTLRVHAMQPVEATLVLRQNGEVLTESAVSLSAGDNRIETLLPAVKDNEAFIEAEIVLPAGLEDLPENNTAALLLSPTVPRPIAVISPNSAHGDAFAKILRDQGLEADVLFPDETPDYMRDWMRYGGIVLLNTPSIELLPHRQRMIQRMVTEYGLGLLILGGKNSFGPGGYYETPLEDLSPVSARVPRESPEVAMVFVLDRSGSMQQPVGDGDRLALAKRATVSALDLLNPQSQIGIVTFDAESSVVYPLQTFDVPAVSEALDKVDPGGGTSIYPGLVAAYDMLKNSESPAKHVIVMTDGLSQPGDWAGILRLMNQANITVSGVAIGTGADVDAVKTIARYGRGAAHVSTDFAALPSILSQEAMMFASPIEEGASPARWTGVTAPFLGDLPAALPPVDGFVLTTPKDDANIAMLTQDKDGNDMPLLAWWRVGNGQVMAFTTDATGSWTDAWHGLAGYGPMFANALRAFHPPLPSTGLTLDLQPENEAITITLSALTREGDAINSISPLAEVLYCQDGNCAAHQHVPLTFKAPGIYVGRFLPEAAGHYEVTLSETTHASIPVVLGEDLPANPRAAYYLAWPESLDPTRGNGDAEWLAAQTGGSEATLQSLRSTLPKTIWEPRASLTPWAIAALVIFMIELIRRYAEVIPLRRRQAKPRAQEGQTQ